MVQNPPPERPDTPVEPSTIEPVPSEDPGRHAEPIQQPLSPDEGAGRTPPPEFGHSQTDGGVTPASDV